MGFAHVSRARCHLHVYAALLYNYFIHVVTLTYVCVRNARVQVKFESVAT